jgi:hypothetical protein
MFFIKGIEIKIQPENKRLIKLLFFRLHRLEKDVNNRNRALGVQESKKTLYNQDFRVSAFLESSRIAV